MLRDILQKLDFIELVRRKTPLTAIKDEEYRGLSPFTNEKTPSFYVNNHSKTWYDFSSGQGGGVLDYIMKTEALERNEAVAFLANIVGTKLDTNTPTATLREIILTTHNYFRKHSSEAVPYLTRRGFSTEIIDKYSLGYAPNSRELISILQSSYNDKDIILSGLVYKNDDGSLSPRLMDRVTFPIRDAYNNIVSFTGRDTTGRAKSKYMHGRSSPLFHKKGILWNFSAVRKLASNDNMVVLCEGTLDALAITEAGLPGIALLGSSPTASQIATLARLVQNIYISFDSDEAGQRGMIKVFKMVSELDADVLLYAVVLPSGLDPDGFIRERGIDEFKSLIRRSQPDTSVIVQSVIRQNANPKKNRIAITSKVIRELLPYVKQQFTYRSLDLIERLSQELGLSRKELHDWIEKDGMTVKEVATATKMRAISIPGPIYERRILYGLLDTPERLTMFKGTGLSEMDFESFLASKVVSLISHELDSAELFDVLKKGLTETEYYDVLSFYSQGLQGYDFESALNIMKLKVFDKMQSRVTDFLGRPLTSREKNSRSAVKKLMYHDKVAE